jgi:predicted TIM-barrel fold metal-dependent hydrolase
VTLASSIPGLELDNCVELPAGTTRSRARRGKMMWWCGEEIIYGGETPIWHPQWALEELWNFKLPADIVEERGYPQLTKQAKRKILGENLARLHGIDVDAKRAQLRAPA